MSTHTLASYVSPATVAIATGVAVQDSGTATTVASLTDQATTQTLFVKGITTCACAAGEIPTVATLGAEVPYLSSGATAVGDLLVAKFGGAGLMKVGTHTAGDTIVAICRVAAADGAMGICQFIGHPLK
jgi:hypothetical protein